MSQISWIWQNLIWTFVSKPKFICVHLLVLLVQYSSGYPGYESVTVIKQARETTEVIYVRDDYEVICFTIAK